MNKNITQEDIERVVKNKKNKLLPYQRLMGIEGFRGFCNGKTPGNDRGAINISATVL
jgi:hypothetical protein